MPKKQHPTDDSRYGRLRDLLDLAVALQGSHVGLSAEDIARRYEISVRTSRRMLKALRDGFGEEALRYEEGPDRVRRWRLRHRLAAVSVRIDAAELAALEAAEQRARRDGQRSEARALASAREKLHALLDHTDATRVEPDLEALIEAQGVAMRPGPHPRIGGDLVSKLRGAILAGRKIELFHDHAGEGRLRRHTVGPLGFLYGTRHYLVAWSKSKGGPVLFRLSRIQRARVLEGVFEPPEGFDLRRYAEQSFGVFQEDAIDVVWRFNPRVANEAREFVFHPTQELEEASDGSLLVRFRAGGRLEMAWHLFTWGPDVEVLQPEELREEYNALLAGALKASSRKVRRAGGRRRSQETAR